MSVQIEKPSIATVPSKLLDRWRSVPVAVVVDLDTSIRQIDPAIRPLVSAADQVVTLGRAFTAQCNPPDFGAVVYTLDRLEKGDMLVIAADGHSEHAMIGDVLCGYLRAKGIAGVVCDGAVRDIATLASWSDFPVYCRSVTPRGPTGKEQGRVNGKVVIGSTEVSAGDWILADADGIAVLSSDELERWIDAAEARLVTEEQWMKRLAQGDAASAVFDL